MTLVVFLKLNLKAFNPKAVRTDKGKGY